MGVPKFYRFISDRYPCINKSVKEHEIPQYDNLYLDMNSIIHTCSHPSDSDIHFRIGKKEFSDEDIFQNVCRYVEIIFSIVKPVDVMYLAFDGVAPRAKMNQQRGHRFRAAKDIDEPAIKNEVLQDDKLFDTNCITTGTIFMTELIDHVKHFVAYKVSTDPAWQKCKIIVSGSEVPGEGEHKIMEYIRYNRAQSNYNPNTRHCLYCLDADLIILGLCTHEPHFSLIREKVTFGQKMSMLTPEESDFYLLHLSLLREYIEYEFAPIKSKLKFPFDLEKIIDDWVLLGFLVGNDFIPQLPNLNIVHGALPLLYQMYMKVLPTLDGYINECGELNVKRFKMYLHVLSKYATLSEPLKMPEFLIDELGSENSNSEENSKIKVPDVFKLAETSVNGDEEQRRKLIVEAFNALSLQRENKKEANTENKETSSVETDQIEESKKEVTSGSPIPNSSMEEYYKNKFKLDKIDRTKILEIIEQYVTAVQWTLRYYYQGCCSWSWYYPYHYAPLISDFKYLQDITFDFTMGAPFLPLQHLLAVLPPANVHLLPKPLQGLLTNQSSPIIDFYPKDFEVDINGKTNDWESIVLIPFIDENKLIKAMEPYIKNLSFKDRKRNTNGLTCVFTHTKTSLGQYPVDTIFGSFVNHAQLKHMEDMNLPRNQLIEGLCGKVSFNLSFPGFPTLKHVPHTFSFAQTNSKFNTHLQTKIERVVLSVTPKPAAELEVLAKEFLGKKVYAYWPYLQEAHVIGITDFKKKIILSNYWKGYNQNNLKASDLSKSAVLNLQDNKRIISGLYKDDHGIEIGETNVLLYIFPTIGERYVCGIDGKVQLQTKWSPVSKTFPYQLIIKEENIKRYSFSLYKSVNDLFINSTTCFMISQPNYGAQGKITNLIEKKHLVSVTFELPVEPDFSSSNKDFFAVEQPNSTYMTCSDMAKKLKITSTLISRMTGSLIVTEEPITSKYHDIGLRIKVPKFNKELSGYTRKDNQYWLYSEKALELIRSYISEFPYLFEHLNKNMKDANSSTFTVSDLFPDGLEQLNLVKVWLAEQKVHYTTFLECHTQTLGHNGVTMLEKYIAEFYSKEHKQTASTIEVKPQALFIPGTTAGLVPPDFKADHYLLDRIVCVKNNFTVPVGLKGTIIGIQEKKEMLEDVFEVLFDSSFTGGLTLYESSEHRCYRLLATDFINISFGQRDARNSKQTKVGTQSKAPKNNDNKANSGNARSLNNANHHNGNKSNNANKTSKISSQANSCNANLKKAHASSKYTEEHNNCNENQPNTSGSKMKSQKSNNYEAKKFKDHHQKAMPIKQSKVMPVKSSFPSEIDDCKQKTENESENLNELVNISQANNTGTRPKQYNFKRRTQGTNNYKQNGTGVGENLNEKLANAYQRNDTGMRPKQHHFKKKMEVTDDCKPKTGDNSKENSVNIFQDKNTETRPKKPFNKKNGNKFQGQKNQHARNENRTKNIPRGVNESNTENQYHASNTLRNPDAVKKSGDSKEDKKE